MNIDTNSVLYLFLFILPGAFSKILRRRFAPVHLSTEKNKSTLIETSEIVVISAVVFCLNNVVIVAMAQACYDDLLLKSLAFLSLITFGNCGYWDLA